MKRKQLSVKDYFADIERLADNLNNRFGKARSFDELYNNLATYFEQEQETQFIKDLEDNPKFKKRLVDLTIDKRSGVTKEEIKAETGFKEDFTSKKKKVVKIKQPRKYVFIATAKGKRVKAYRDVVKYNKGTKKARVVTRYRDSKGRFVKVKK